MIIRSYDPNAAEAGITPLSPALSPQAGRGGSAASATAPTPSPLKGEGWGEGGGRTAAYSPSDETINRPNPQAGKSLLSCKGRGGLCCRWIESVANPTIHVVKYCWLRRVSPLALSPTVSPVHTGTATGFNLNPVRCLPSLARRGTFHTGVQAGLCVCPFSCGRNSSRSAV